MNRFQKPKVFYFFLILSSIFLIFGHQSLRAQEVQYSAVVIDDPNPHAGASFGAGVAGCDDINRDGIPDLLIPSFDRYAPGQVFVFSGADTTLLLTINDPTGQINRLFGECLTSVDDINADGVPDILVGDQWVDVGTYAHQGRAYIFSGSNGVLLRTIDDPEPQSNAWFGWGLCRIEDIDGDTVRDFVIPACGQYGLYSNRGKVFVFSGLTGALIRTLEIPNSRFFGEWTAELGDINGDGVTDILAGDRFINSGTGQAFAFSGANGALLLTIDNPNPQPSGEFGFRLDGTGDVDSDGVPDMLVGAASQVVGGYRAGQAFVISGANGGLIHTLNNPYPLNGGCFGWSVAGVGDVNFDGVPDMLVGDSGQPVDGNAAQGRAFLFSGFDGTLLATLDNPIPQSTSYFGEMVADVGDLNGDGVPDLLIGAPGQNVGGNLYQGEACLFLSIVSVEQALQSLINDVRNLNLQSGIANSLDAKLENVIRALSDVNTHNNAAAISSLQAFINATEAQRGKAITEEDADALIAAAQRIIDMLSSD